MEDIDYVRMYAKKAREDNSVFEQHRKFINSQLQASREIFRKRFGTENFEENARKYLKERGLI